jgi:hypothetical protein
MRIVVPYGTRNECITASVTPAGHSRVAGTEATLIALQESPGGRANGPGAWPTLLRSVDNWLSYHRHSNGRGGFFSAPGLVVGTAAPARRA